MPTTSTVSKNGPVLLVIVLAATFTSIPARAKINCRLAKSADEVLICQNSDLLKLDERLASVYSELRNTLAGADRRDLERKQGEWLKTRRSCGRDRACVKQAYLSRIDTLGRFITGGKPERKLTTLTWASGKCLQLRLAPDMDLTKTCNSKIFNAVYDDGRTSFTFMAEPVSKEGKKLVVVITFSGTGNVATSADSAVHTVDGIISGFDEQPRSSLSAVGKCQFSNPFTGHPAQTECDATTNEGKFVGKFLTDGSEPTVKHYQ